MRRALFSLARTALLRRAPEAPKAVCGLRLCSSTAGAMFPIPQYVLLAVGGVSGAVVAALYAFQEKLIYHPTIPAREYASRPDEFMMPYEDVEIVADDGTQLHAWLIKQADGASRASATFVYFHGNAGNIGDRLPDARKFYARGYNLLMVSYRGYGESNGAPSERGIVQDATAALAYAADRSDVLDINRIYLFGRSIGGAVAVAAASGANAGLVRGLVIENSFTSIDDMIDVVLPVLGPVKFLNRNKWNSLTRISELRIPILFISGLRDELCPPVHMRKLFDAASKSRLRREHHVEEGGHNDTWFYGGNAYRNAIDEFVKAVER